MSDGLPPPVYTPPGYVRRVSFDTLDDAAEAVALLRGEVAEQREELHGWREIAAALAANAKAVGEAAVSVQGALAGVRTELTAVRSELATVREQLRHLNDISKLTSAAVDVLVLSLNESS